MNELRLFRSCDMGTDRIADITGQSESAVYNAMHIQRELRHLELLNLRRRRQCQKLWKQRHRQELRELREASR